MSSHKYNTSLPPPFCQVFRQLFSQLFYNALSIIELGYSRINNRTSERTNRGVRVCSVCSGMFGVVRMCSDVFGVVRLVRFCSVCSVLFALFAFVRCVRICSHPCSFVRSAFRFPFSVFSSLISLQQKKVSPFGKTFSKSCLLNIAEYYFIYSAT